VNIKQDLFKKIKGRFKNSPVSSNSNDQIRPLDDSAIEFVLKKFLYRVSFILTEKDIHELEILNKNDLDGSKVNKFLSERAPYFQEILAEEVLKFMQRK
jgi:hypothetical protein